MVIKSLENKNQNYDKLTPLQKRKATTSLQHNEYDVEALSLKLRIHQYLKKNDVVIDCCKKILKVDSDNFEVKDILEGLEEN